MRKWFLLLFLMPVVTDVRAQGSLRSSIGITAGDGKLGKPYNSDFGPSFSIDARLNYVGENTLASAGFGAILINDKRAGYIGTYTTTELFLQLPVGLGIYLDLGAGTHLILGGEISLLYSGGGHGAFYEAGPDIDLLWTSRGGTANGLFAKGVFNLNKDENNYQPRYLGIGYKVMFGSNAKGKKKQPVRNK